MDTIFTTNTICMINGMYNFYKEAYDLLNEGTIFDNTHDIIGNLQEDLQAILQTSSSQKFIQYLETIIAHARINNCHHHAIHEAMIGIIQILASTQGAADSGISIILVTTLHCTIGDMIRSPRHDIRLLRAKYFSLVHKLNSYRIRNKCYVGDNTLSSVVKLGKKLFTKDAECWGDEHVQKEYYYLCEVYDHKPNIEIEYLAQEFLLNSECGS
ncbi:MAG: hypothetical protein ACRCY4_09555 [Brevinema sp.]